MATKTITVTTEAYESLKSLKEPSESFSETIKRVSGKHSFSEFIGILSEESARKLEKTINGIRKRDSKEYNERIKRLTNILNGAE